MEDSLEDYYDYHVYDYHMEKAGSSPGTLVIDRDARDSVVVVIDYNPDRADRVELSSLEQCLDFLASPSVSWIDVSGLGNEQTLKAMGEIFHLHPLTLEDIVNVPQRPKMEQYDDHLLIIARMVMLNPDRKSFTTEQVSFVLGERFLLTVQEEPTCDTFNPVRDRIRLSKGLIRSKGCDYLTYTLIDTIIDGFFPILENYGERLEDLEEEVVRSPSTSTLEKIYDIRRELLTLRRAIWPQRDAIYTLVREKSPLISEPVQVYLRDCYDHAVQVIDMVETYRELASSLMDVYLSSVNNRLGEVMKTLTVISSIFIPLTFIAGVYGMNFNTEVSPWNMPELNAYWGYPLCLAMMGACTLVLLWFFWKKGWLGGNTPEPVNLSPGAVLKAFKVPRTRSRKP